MDNRILKSGGLISLLVGFPIGLASILVVLSIASISNLFTMELVVLDGWAILGLIISFVGALWIGGQINAKDIYNERKILFISFKYSLIVNSIIWMVFILIHFFTNNFTLDIIFGLLIPIFGWIVSVILTPFSIGLIITILIKRRIMKISAHNNTYNL